jgi:hypothetical protein
MTIIKAMAMAAGSEADMTIGAASGAGLRGR